MEIFLSAETWLALLTLTSLEIILGVDNVIFISIVTNKLPKDQQKFARRIGLAIAMIFRVALLVMISWLTQKMTSPLFSVGELTFSVRELIFIAGGLFLLAKSTSEIHSKMEIHEKKPHQKAANNLISVIVQIIILDIVFSFDSILTAVGMTNHLSLMIIAVVASLFIMMFFADKISHFISKHPTLEILALSFLILIGFMLVLEGVHIEVPKAYIYFAVFFSLMVEVVNMKVRKKHSEAERNKTLNN